MGKADTNRLCYSVFLWILISIAGATGCDDASPAEGDSLRRDTAQTVDVFMPSVDALEDGWNSLTPGGDTICARGMGYSFLVRKGIVNRLIIDFSGGGACWDEVSCRQGSEMFNETADGRVVKQETLELGGIYDITNTENPFRDWHHVYVSYCTGDVHWGNATTRYGKGADAFSIEHRGAVNVAAVLRWVYENYADPDDILVTGVSAGAYGSIFWAPVIMDHYPNARITQLADAGAGVMPNGYLTQLLTTWGATEAMADWWPDTAPVYEDIYIAIANAYPEHRFSQINSAYDDVQVFYYGTMGGNGAADWNEKMMASQAAISQHTTNFFSYVAQGDTHGAILWDDFYGTSVADVSVLDWMKGLLFDEVPVSVGCPDCITGGGGI